MVRSSVYEQVGLLVARFFAHMEEIELFWLILLAGHSIVAVTAATVYHLGGGSLPASDPRKTYLNFRNNLLLLHKNLPDSTRRRKLVRRRLLDTLAWVKFVVAMQWGNAGAVLRAHRDFRRMARLYTVHPDHDLLDERQDTHRNIIADHYLRGIRKFSQLK